MASAYSFAVNIVMLTNITNNKTHNIYDLLMNYSCYWENMKFYGQEYILVYLKSTKVFDLFKVVTSVT